MQVFDRIAQFLMQHVWLVGILSLVVVPAAFLINLGLQPFDSDEPTRALVALEMIFSGNYITPTINAEFYYNKPPFYNWIIISSWTLWGEISEFATRFPTVVSMLGYSLTIFLFSRIHFPKRWALLNALLFLTCGRILYYDSFLGLIDICFSWVIFTMFMVIYHYFKLKRYWTLFLLSYFLCAVAFLLKGLPSVVFLGTTLLVLFIWKRAFWKLFSVQHIVGFLLFAGILAAYYGLYNEYNSLDTVFKTLFTESSKRTVVRFGIGQTILHLFTFPVEMVYHFLPWSLLILFLIRRSFWRLLKQNDFIQFCAFTFFFAIIPYWTSPEVFPRYLLMLAPLIFTVFTYFLAKAEQEQSRTSEILFTVFLVVSGLVVIGVWAVPWVPALADIPGVWIKVLVLFVLMLAAFSVMCRQRPVRYIAFGCFLLITRLGFSWFVLPARYNESEKIGLRAESVHIGKTYSNDPIEMTYEGSLGHFASFYVSRERGEPLRFASAPASQDGTKYIVSPYLVETNPDLRVVDSLTIVWENQKRYLVEYRERK